ncbi:MAG: hypothetical protein ACHRXM_19600 [Isosphaerales bacterium]
MAREPSGIEQLLASRIRLDPVSVGSQLLSRAVRRRMRELALDDLAAYEHRLRSSAQELEALIEDVVVAESWFFRDERPFLWFRDHVGKGWLNELARPPLRILSLACAEESYSIAMVLSDLGPPPRGFVINAVDVAVIDRLLAADGLLVIGHADRLDSSGAQARFTAVADPGCFAYRRAARGDADLPRLKRHDEALLALALLAERRGDHNAAAGFRQRAERTMTMTGKRVN